MSEEWEFYFTRVNDSFASILVDVGLRDTVPDPARTWLLRLWVHFRQVDADGFPGEEESNQFADIEQAIIQEVTGSLDAVLAGRVTTAGRREFFCYAPSFAGFEDAVARCMNRFSGYKWDVETELDPDWEHYLGLLYPSTRDWQQIQNRQVIEQLSQHGDSLEQKRMVFHWAYFPSEASRSQFEADLKQRGFEVTDWSTDDSPDEANLYGIGFERIDHVNWESINQVTLELLELAESHSGNYDGWETTVEGVEP
jgi:uncharacterized protein (TIGR01619 family)